MIRQDAKIYQSGISPKVGMNPNIGIVRKACREGRCTIRVPRSIVRVPPTDGGAQAQPAFKGYSLQVIFGRLKALHTTTAVGIAVSPCMPGPCWVGVGRSRQTGSGSPWDPHQTTTVYRTQATNRLRLPQSCPAMPSLADAHRRREGLTPQ